MDILHTAYDLSVKLVKKQLDKGILDNGGGFGDSLRKLKKRTEGTKEETGDGLYVRGRSDHSGKAHYGGNLRFKLRGGTGKLKCFICHSEGHLKRDYPKKKSSGFVKKGKRDHDSDSSDDEGHAYFGEVLVVVGNDEMTGLVMDSGGSYHMTHMRDFLYDFKEDVRYVSGLRRSLISSGTLEKEGYNVKMQLGRIKGAQGDHEAKVFQVSNDDVAVAQRRLEDKQLKEKTNTDCLVKEREKEHLGIKVGENMTVTEVPGQKGAQDLVQKARSQTLRSELESLKMKESETISVFASKLSSIRAKFRNLGTTLESKIIVRKLLDSVLKKFLPIMETIEQYQDLDEMSFKEAVGRLTAFEERIKSQDTLEANNQDKLLLASSNNQIHSKGRDRNFNKEAKESMKWKNNPNARGTRTNQGTKDKITFRCCECGTFGHFVTMYEVEIQ
uniref:Zinc finger, CCHC-type n=1 Tax=Tanacetum cinerariifolium TaxID=118510 RepID=A0A699H6I7_TANCI|nr:zinc finger, CCHC-type [Tanacetum cinerariifolium]